MPAVEFNLYRIFQLIKNDILSAKKQLIYVVLIISLLSFVITAKMIVNALFLLGAIVTSKAFEDCHVPERAYRYLTLPVSNLERLFSKWFVTGPLLAISLWSLITLLQLIYPFGIMTRFPVNGFIGYLVFHSIILFGSLIFRTHPLIKTIFVISLVNAIIAYLGYRGFILSVNEFPGLVQSVAKHEDLFRSVAYCLFWYVTPIFFWCLSYWRLKTLEIN